MIKPNRARHSPAQRIAHAHRVILEARAEMVSAIEWTHEEDGCLPMPDLNLPESEIGLDAFVKALQDNLFEPTTTVSTLWDNAIEACDHVIEQRRREIHDLVVDWYRMVIILPAMVNGTPVFFDINQRRKHFNRTLSKVEASERCRCGRTLHDGEGWDGRCGTCVDRSDSARRQAASNAATAEDDGCE